MSGSLGGVGGVACAVLACACLGMPAPASAARHKQPDQAPQVDVSVTGSLTIAWTGDPADGCAAAGVCGVSGTLELPQSGEGQGPRPAAQPPLEVSDANAVARVTDTAPDGTVTRCSDIVPSDFFLSLHDT